MTDKKNLCQKINKKQMIISIVVFIVLFAFYGMFIFNNNKYKDVSVELSKEMASSKKFDGLDITNIKGFVINGLYQISFEIENNTDNDYEEKAVKLVFLDKDGDIQSKMDTFIPGMKKGEISESIYVLNKSLLYTYNFVISDK